MPRALFLPPLHLHPCTVCCSGCSHHIHHHVRSCHSVLDISFSLLLLVLAVAICCAQKNYNPLPPQVAFISSGQLVGTIRTNIGSLPTKGSISYLAAVNPGDTEYEKREVIIEFGLEQTNTWEVETNSQIDTWEITNIDPTTCFHQTFDEASGTYPQCTAWTKTPGGQYLQNCTISLDSIQLADLSVAVVLSDKNQLVSYNDQIMAFGQFVEGETVTMTQQGSTPPSPSDFTRPSACDGSLSKQ